MTHTPVVKRVAAGRYQATPEASGPFGTVQGGVLAGLSAVEIMRHAPEGFQPLSFRTEFLRPTPLGTDLAIEVEKIQEGRRTATFDAVITAVGKRCVRSTLTLVLPVQVATLSEAVPAPITEPTLLRRVVSRSPHGGPWLSDRLEAWVDGENALWFRWSVPLCDDDAAFARALAPADWTHGIARPNFPGPPPLSAWPNSDLTVHVDRQPEGEWIGLLPQGRWRSDGVGIGYGELRDRRGQFARVAMGVVLFP